MSAAAMVNVVEVLSAAAVLDVLVVQPLFVQPSKSLCVLTATLPPAAPL